MPQVITKDSQSSSHCYLSRSSTSIKSNPIEDNLNTLDSNMVLLNNSSQSSLPASSNGSSQINTLTCSPSSSSFTTSLNNSNNIINNDEINCIDESLSQSDNVNMNSNRTSSLTANENCKNGKF